MIVTIIDCVAEACTTYVYVMEAYTCSVCFHYVHIRSGIVMHQFLHKYMIFL